MATILIELTTAIRVRVFPTISRTFPQRRLSTPFSCQFPWSLLVVTACVSTFGCGNDQKLKETVKGLQEENTVLREKISDLEKRIEARDTESQSGVERIKKEHEDFLTNERETHRSQIAQIEKEVATLQLELGAAKREKIALQEMIEREPRIIAARENLMRTDGFVLAIMLLILLMIVTFLVFRCRSVSDRLKLLTMQQAGELRRLGEDV